MQVLSAPAGASHTTATAPQQQLGHQQVVVSGGGQVVLTSGQHTQQPGAHQQVVMTAGGQQLIGSAVSPAVRGSPAQLGDGGPLRGSPSQLVVAANSPRPRPGQVSFFYLLTITKLTKTNRFILEYLKP